MDVVIEWLVIKLAMDGIMCDNEGWGGGYIHNYGENMGNR